MASNKLGKPSTQYDDLLHLAARQFIEAAADEHSDLSGEWMAFDATAAGVLWDDAQYESDVKDVFEDLGEDQRPTRGHMYQHFAVIMRHLRRRGHLDHAPTPQDHGAADFLRDV